MFTLPFINLSVKNYSVKKYTDSDFQLWNDFINTAKNATFLFHRNFMEYHKDRFDDCSLLIFHGETLVAVLPANLRDEKLYSHQGLTYGGFVFQEQLKIGQVLAIVRETLKYLSKQKIKSCFIKLIPEIYCTTFSDEIEYILFALQGQLVRRDCLAVIDMKHKPVMSRVRIRGNVRGIKNKLEIKETDDFGSFWNKILIPNLYQKYQATPVHTVEEIHHLKKLFPEIIRQFNVYENENIVAGVTVFDTPQVAHLQYVSGTERDNQLGSIDFLYHHLITKEFKDKKYFDFGPSHGYSNLKINKSLLYFKESFGAKSVVQDFYEVQTANYKLLDSILI